MAQRGTVVFRSPEVIQHQTINSAASYTKFTMTKISGNWPTAAYKINNVVVRYTKRSVGYSDLSYWKLTSPTGTAGTCIGVGGSYWTGEGSTAMANTNKNTYTGDYTSGGTVFYLGIYADYGVTSSTNNHIDPLGNITEVTITSSGTNGGQIQSGTYVYLTITWELTEAASTFTIYPSPIELGEPMTTTISPGIGASSHKIRYSVGSQNSGWLTVTGTSHTYTIPTSWADQITASSAGTLKVEVQSYNSSNTLIGTTSKTTTANVPGSLTPSASSITATLINGLSGAYIQRISKVQISVTAAGASGSTIQSIVISGNDIFDDASVKPDAQNTKTVTSDVLSVSGSNVYTATITDSRGRTNTATVTINVVAYQFPAMSSVDVERWDETAGAASPAGTKLRLTAAFLTTAGITGNNLTTEVYYREQGVSNWGSESSVSLVSGTPVILSRTYAATTAFEIKVVVYDSASNIVGYSTSQIAEIGTGKTYLYMQRTNNMLGIGAYANGSDRVYINPDWDLWTHGKEILDLVRDLIYPVGSIYMSISNTNPGTIFGGTWTQIKDTFLLAAGDTYAGGATGGEATHTLIRAELPEIKGSFRMRSGSDSGLMTNANDVISVTQSGNSDVPVTAGTGTKAMQQWNLAVGSNTPHNNMPPYLAVYVWKRTA